MWTVRAVTFGNRATADVRDTKFPTKKQALNEVARIRSASKSQITRIGHLYIARKD
jgi:hypothetical protein